MQKLHQYRSGAAQALQNVLRSDPELQAIIKTGADATYKELKEIERTLTDRLALLNSQHKSLSSELEIYYKQENELNEIIDVSDKALRKTKLAVIVWGRVHRLMASGITDPATVDILGMMKKAVDTAL